MFWTRGGRCCLGLLMALLLLAAALPLRAQSSGGDVLLQVPADQVGLLGYVRGGQWTAMRLNLQNQDSKPRQVRCQWLVDDPDGDQLYASRDVSLSPQRQQQFWLYAPLPFSTKDSPSWRVRVLDAQSNELLTWTQAAPMQLLPKQTAVIGIIGNPVMGLDRYAADQIQHEKIHFLRGLRPSELPDRWYGFSLLDALIWTPSSAIGAAAGVEADPGNPALSRSVQQALRQWVRRGGHLVIILPAMSDPWTSSPLADLLPACRINTITDVPPERCTVLGGSKEVRPTAMTMRSFEPFGDTAVVLREQETSGEPIAVAAQYGLGRVTLIGVDLSDPRVIHMGMPNGPLFWRAIFGWRSRGYTRGYIEGELGSGRMEASTYQERGELGGFIASAIQADGATSGALWAAVLLFVVYFLAAVFGSYLVLSQRKMLQYSWLAFVALVLLFAAVSWGGAYLVRPVHMKADHLSVVDIDAGQKVIRTRSWISLLVPRHGLIDVAVAAPDEQAEDPATADPAALGQGDALLPLDPSGAAIETRFLNPQPYQIAAASPRSAALPMRSTVKQLQLSYLASMDESAKEIGDNWELGQSGVLLADGLLVGKIWHSLPGPLLNVRLVYCPGDGQPPLIWPVDKSWSPNQRLILHIPGAARPLVADMKIDSKQVERDFAAEGYLGFLVGSATSQSMATAAAYNAWAGEQGYSAGSESRSMDMLSFYSLLPPPQYRTSSVFNNTAVRLDRALARGLDISALCVFRRLIVMGTLEHSPLPAPLTVEGRRIPESGKTFVRWIIPLALANSPAAAAPAAQGQRLGGPAAVPAKPAKGKE